MEMTLPAAETNEDAMRGTGEEMTGGVGHHAHPQ